jgi:hypothetical protein
MTAARDDRGGSEQRQLAVADGVRWAGVVREVREVLGADGRRGCGGLCWRDVTQNRRQSAAGTGPGAVLAAETESDRESTSSGRGTVCRARCLSAVASMCLSGRRGLSKIHSRRRGASRNSAFAQQQRNARQHGRRYAGVGSSPV